MASCLILYTSGSAGTGSEFQLSDTYATSLMVFVPSASYSTAGVKLVGRLVNSDPALNPSLTASYFDMAAQPANSVDPTDTVINVVSGGLYYYPNVGGTAVKIQSDNTQLVTIVGNALRS